MNPHDAQSSLDDIRRHQARTREEIVRQSFALPYVLLAALGLFVGFASADLERPWSTVATLCGFGLFAGVGIVRELRASVRRKPTVQEVVFFSGVMIGICMFFGIARIAAWALFDVPAHGLLSQATVAAAATAVAYVAMTPVNRQVLGGIIAHYGGRG
ncbi:hypothetical protein ACTMTI_24400 [Nonomuraea sp. H19]|uniref:hypothetical protein n=1 Tax=Nonomuraea sp. H19 TaxID=3452206 RepID=UPI003F8A91C1